MIDPAARLAFAGDLKGAAAAVRGRGDVTAAWVRAYVAAARGSFGDAERRARTLVDDPDVGVAASLTLGSVLRQTARHADAANLDAVALDRATSKDARAHALVSLAADAVGMLDPRTCAAHLDEAAAIARGWRARVRLGWVRTEHALLTGSADAPVHAADALRRSRKAGARRHEAKSLLFLGVALGHSREGAGALRGARDLAAAIGARPISDVASGQLQRHR